MSSPEAHQTAWQPLRIVLCWYVAECHAFCSAILTLMAVKLCLVSLRMRMAHEAKSDGLIFGSTVKYHHGQWHIGNNKVVHFRRGCSPSPFLDTCIDFCVPQDLKWFIQFPYISFFEIWSSLFWKKSTEQYFVIFEFSRPVIDSNDASRHMIECPHTPFLLLLEEQWSFLSSYYIRPFLASCTELL